jgi:hypothetical protein
MTRKQRQLTAPFKLEPGLEVLKWEKPIAQICRERQGTDWRVYQWRGAFLENVRVVRTVRRPAPHVLLPVRAARAD